MRVAVTDFVALANVEGRYFWWEPQSRDWLMPNAPTQEHAAFLHPLWGEKLLSRQHLDGLDPFRVGVSFGSSKGWPAHLVQWSETGQPWPFCDFDGRFIAASARATGPLLCPVAACASGAHALALGARLIETGRAAVVLAGANEPPQPEIILAAYRNMGALSRSGVMRPFDARRDGFLPASGGALFVLESEENARRRGATIHGFLTGYSMKCDATHMTSMSPSGDGIARAIKDALKQAGNPRIDYINAHGTATRQNDAIESRALKSVFGAEVPVSSTKAMTGHLLGAAGAVEAALCLLALRDGFAPPTLHLEAEDAELDLDYLPLYGREIEMKTVLSLSYGFGGHIGALVFEKT